MTEKEEAVLKAAIQMYEGKIEQESLFSAVRTLLTKAPKEKRISYQDKTKEQQERCISLFGRPIGEYCWKSGSYIHKSIS